MSVGRRQRPASAQAAEMQAAVQQLLTAHAFYSPLELLLATNRLGYDDYQAWRRGEHAALDELFSEGTSGVQTLIEQADSWARDLGLEQGRVPLLGTDAHAGAELRASANPRLDDLLHAEYRRDVDHEQPDLFLDGAEMEAQNALIDVLTMRDLASVRVRLRALTSLDPSHWSVVHAEALIEVLEAPPPEGPEEALSRLGILEHRWLPAAAALLRAGARDFLTPCWRNIGRALENAPFDPGEPKNHASWAYLNGLDWEGVRRTVLDASDWKSAPALQIRLAEAEWRLRDRRAALGVWFALCWQAPAHFRDCIEAADFPDSALKNAWGLAQNQDFDLPITPPWFPAWMVVEEPGIARGAVPCGGDTDPQRTFDHLLALRGGLTDREDRDHRRALRGLHPELLGRYLGTLGD